MFGISGDPGPCDTTSFASAKGVDITVAEAFSISRDRSLAVIQAEGLAYQLALPGGAPQPIDLGVYPAQNFAMSPDGDALFYTASIEPPTLLGALRSGESWKLDATVPKATFVGTPSADEFGPRRMLARLQMTSDQLQEYEDDDGVWTPHGELQKLVGVAAPNLTPDGLSMVYSVSDPTTGDSVVFLASRASMTDWFGDPVAILPGQHSAPQLLDVCRQLFVVDNDGVLRRYDRP